MVLVDADADASSLDRLKGLLAVSVDMLKAATPMREEDVKSDLVPRPIHNRATVDLMGEAIVWLGWHEMVRMRMTSKRNEPASQQPLFDCCCCCAARRAHHHQN